MKNFLAEINERTRSPLIYSFLIAWVIFNWKIPVSLLFEDVKELEAHGYYSHLQFIQAKLNWSKGFFHPFYSALIYTFGFPFVKNGISIFNAWINRWGNKSILKTSKNGMVGIERYLQLKSKSDLQFQELEDAIKSETSQLNLIQKLQTEISHLTGKITYLETEKTQKDNELDSSILDGFWSYEFKFDARNVQSGYIQVISGQIYKSDVSKSKKSIIDTEIVLFKYIHSINRILVVTEPLKQVGVNEHYLFANTIFFNLEINPEKTTLIGKSGNKSEINVIFNKFN